MDMRCDLDMAIDRLPPEWRYDAITVKIAGHGSFSRRGPEVPHYLTMFIDGRKIRRRAVPAGEFPRIVQRLYEILNVEGVLPWDDPKWRAQERDRCQNGHQ